MAVSVSLSISDSLASLFSHSDPSIGTRVVAVCMPYISAGLGKEGKQTEALLSARKGRESRLVEQRTHQSDPILGAHESISRCQEKGYLQKKFTPDDRHEPRRTRSHQRVLEVVQVKLEKVTASFWKVLRWKNALAIHEQSGWHVSHEEDHEQEVQGPL